MAAHKSVTSRFIPLILSVTLTLVLAQTPNDAGWSEAAFCSDYACPRYVLMNKTAEYEVRMYEPTAWVNTSSTSGFMSFMRLFSYINGENEDGRKISMTVPVLKRISKEDNSPSTMSFFVSPAQSPAPQPKNNKVNVDPMPKQKVYVRTFGGFASQQNYIDQADALINALPASEEYQTDYWYTAGYNSPWQFFNRHNEVWFISK